MDSNNSIHGKVLQDLAVFGVQITPDILQEEKQEKFKTKNFFSPRRPDPIVEKVKLQNSDSLIFGVELAEVPMIYSVKFGLVPKFLCDAFRILGKHLEVQGLFRVSGSKERMRKLKEQINENEDISDCHPGDLSNLVQQFFKELPNPLITRKVWKLMIACEKYLKDPSLLKRALTKTCLLLPTNNLYTLRYLVNFLAKVARMSKSNRMTSTNLAVVFAPSLLHSTSMTIAGSAGDGSTSFVEVELVQILLDSYRELEELPSEMARYAEDDEPRYSFLYGFNRAMAPVNGCDNQRKKRKFTGSSNDTNVTFNIPDQEESTIYAKKRLKVDNLNDTTMSRKKKFLNLFSKKKKSLFPLSTTMPEENLHHTTMGETTVEKKTKKHPWRRFLDRIRKPKNKGKDHQNMTNVACNLTENMNPDSSWFAWPNYFDVSQMRGTRGSITNKTLDASFQHQPNPTPACARYSPKYVERLRMAEQAYLERRQMFDETIKSGTGENLDEAVLDDEDYDDDYNDLNRAKIDSFDEPHDMTNLSEALLMGTYCGQSSRADKKTRQEGHREKAPTIFDVAEPTKKAEFPKTSLKSLDSGLVLQGSDGSLSGSSPDEIEAKARSSGLSEDQKHFKSPLALNFASRRALVFDSAPHFTMQI